MSKNKKLTKEEELLLQDFGRNVSTKSSVLFYCNAFVVSAVPLCELKVCMNYVYVTVLLLASSVANGISTIIL